MTERSYFWDGLVTGDASLAPYTANTWNDILEVIIQRAANQGVVENLLNELLVSGIAVSVSVDTGNAINSGSFYENSLLLSVAIPTPVTDPRIDRIVVRKDWGLQTIRVARIAGTENASPTAPALVQIDGSQWDVPLAQARIETTGVIAVTDEREFARTRLALVGIGWILIEEFNGDGTTGEHTFSNISSNFKHLMIIGMPQGDGGIASPQLQMNNDIATNYNQLALRGQATAAVSRQIAGSFFSNEVLASAGFGGFFFAIIPNYTNTVLLKNVVSSSIGFLSAPTGTSLFGGGIYTGALAETNSLRLFLSTGNYPTGVKFSLYGLL